MANEWILGQPVQTDDTNDEWILGQPRIVQTAAAPGANAPTGHLAGPLWGSLAGPIFSLFITVLSLIKRLL